MWCTVEPMPRTAAIIGATGLVGGHLLDVLLADPEYSRVVALVRRDLGRTHERLETRIIDFDRLDAEPLEVDDAFCALGTTIKKAGSKDAFRKVDYDYVLAFAKVAKRHGSRFALVSSLGASASSSVFYNRVKGEIEDAIKALAFESYYAFRPSILAGEREEKRFGERVGMVFANVVGAIPIPAIRRVRPIHARDVARAMVEVVKRGEPGAHVLSSERIQAIADAAG